MNCVAKSNAFSLFISLPLILRVLFIPSPLVDLVSTIALYGENGWVDDSLSVTQGSLAGIAADPLDGSVYFSEYSPCRIRKLKPNG